MKYSTILFLIVSMLCHAQEQSFSTTNELTVEFLSDQDEQKLRWQMPREVNTAYFLVQQWDCKSEKWMNLAKLEAKGHTMHPSSYSLEIDEISLEPIRVLLVQMDGLRIASEAIKVKQSPQVASNKK